ncbi:hypothetical protein [Rhizobium etli]|uniref:Uncharacterized protein n=1 Tax=Rhizobium etli TaxID=29449 RepID=A0A7W6ZPE2_RHIET|nr:hypothetical protein [Rhizobium etli]MBB4483471.1 hypothetical protein [Rhizobium etli]MBB4539309.1 hypothetical protein [Rhizobium etli]
MDKVDVNTMQHCSADITREVDNGRITLPADASDISGAAGSTTRQDHCTRPTPSDSRLILLNAKLSKEHAGIQHTGTGGSMRMPPQFSLHGKNRSLWSRIKSALSKASGEGCVEKPSSGWAQGASRADSSSVLRSSKDPYDIGYLAGLLWNHSRWDNPGKLMPLEFILELGKVKHLPGPRNQYQPTQLEIHGEHYTAEVRATPNPDVLFGQSRQVYLIHHPRGGLSFGT